MSALTTITPVNSSATMSSREIAEVTGKAHKNVLRDIEKMLIDLNEDRLKFEHIYQDAYGRDQKEYALPKNLTLNLIAGYRADLRLKIINRWMELEAAPSTQFAVPKSMSEALRLAADLSEKNETLLNTIETRQKELAVARTQVTTLMPRAAVADRIALCDGMYGIQQAAKILQVGPKFFANWLRTNGWIYKRPGSQNNLAYQPKINAGYLTHKISPYTDANGENKTRDEVKILPKGIDRLAREVPGAVIDLDYYAPAGTSPANFQKQPEPAS